MRDFWRGAWRLSVFLLLILLFSPLQFFFALKGNFFLTRIFHWLMARVLNIHVETQGTPQKALLISNHLSWVDILVLGSVTPLRFIAKSEVASWPLFGQLAWLQGTIFVERDNRQAVISTREKMQTCLHNTPLVLFAEGTTSSGTSVLPFVASLILTPAQPVTLYYSNVAAIAWYGEMTLLPHFWAMFKRKETHVKVIFHGVITSTNRKESAQLAETLVRETYEKCRSTDKNGFGAA